MLVATPVDVPGLGVGVADGRRLPDLSGFSLGFDDRSELAYDGVQQSHRVLGVQDRLDHAHVELLLRGRKPQPELREGAGSLGGLSLRDQRSAAEVQDGHILLGLRRPLELDVRRVAEQPVREGLVAARQFPCFVPCNVHSSPFVGWILTRHTLP